MLPQKYRLRSSRDIRSVLRRGKIQHLEGLLTVRWLIGASAVSRFAVVVSQKVDKRAVIRNRIKRSLLGAIERTLAASSDKAADVVVVVRRVTLQNLKSARELLSEFLKKVLSKGYGRGYSR